ncbi:MAG: hypothetical protein ACK5JR_06970 [Tropicimonas sp.]|uniref:hypothetical protein n=1 Tax=Tropicimonas sp. TaxID=2067044 RepID=UPI003A83C032
MARLVDRMQTTRDLGTIIASGQACDLTYDQTAIPAWIDETVNSADMSSATDLAGATGLTRFTPDRMSESHLTAHCHAVSNTAGHCGFRSE